eukprot:TRINITY_DN29399_c0_g1_i1.p1 TRINITY_DN29399_c0_g1~~TRINITY_DN29399_c0_g1_i1.p1  ORF type:complete len:332 (-),score=89.23 TRINITY_DN29399_c0_g1_i1:16-1011(-)
MGRDIMPVIFPPPQKRTPVSPVIFLLLVGLAIYFIWLDIALYISIHYCNNAPGETTMPPSISVKSIMQPPTVHYMEVPISEWLELHLSLSLLFTPNFISFTGVVFGLLSAWFVTAGTRSSILLAVFLYKLRDLMDALDGVLARGVGAINLPTPGTSGYYVDGWCDVASETALILAIGHLLERAGTSCHWKTVHSPTRLCRLFDPITHHPIMSRMLAPISLPIFCLGIQSILSAICWNWTTTQLNILLETGADDIKEKQIQLFQSSTCWLVMFFWRLLNPHMLSQALLVSLLVDRYKQWVEHAMVVVSLPLITLCTASWIWVQVLSSKLTVI